MDISKLNFYSGANYMKRDITTGTRDMIAASGATTTYDVPHNIGGDNVPQFLTSAEVARDKVIWRRNQFYVGFGDGSTSPTYPELSAWITTSKLTLSLYNPTGASVTVPVYWVIYKDYGTTS